MPYIPILGLHEEAKESLSTKEIDIALVSAIEYEKNLSIAQNKKNSQRSKFLAELSNNGKYKNLQTNIRSQSAKSKDTDLSRENIERS